jgi:hypothetical protein
MYFLNPNFITGFSDAEGCFFIQFIKDNTYKTGYQIQASFIIGLNKKDIALLEIIQSGSSLSSSSPGDFWSRKNLLP